MRTTLTLDDDVAALLREDMHRSGLSFREAVNRALRMGLLAESGASDREPFRTRGHSFGFRAGIDLDRLNELADELESDAFLARHVPNMQRP